MTNAVRTQLIKIGNSRGIRLPKALLEQAGLEHDVDVEVRNGTLVIRAAAHPRAAWDAAFPAMVERGDDRLLDADTAAMTTWDIDYGDGHRDKEHL